MLYMFIFYKVLCKQIKVVPKKSQPCPSLMAGTQQQGKFFPMALQMLKNSR